MGRICTLLFYLLCFTYLLSFNSCNLKDDYKKRNYQKSEKLRLLDDYVYVHLIPDSLRTPEQKELILLLQNVLVEYMVIENNHFVFKMDKKEFINEGIPEPYYLIIMNDVKQNNVFIDSNNIKNVDSLLKESYKKYEIVLNE